MYCSSSRRDPKVALPAAESRVPGGVAPRDSAPPGRDVKKNLYKLASFVIRIYIAQQN